MRQVEAELDRCLTLLRNKIRERGRTQLKVATATWNQAIALCRDDGRRLLPNCITVSQINFLRALRQSAKRTSKPYDGQRGVPLPDLLVRTLETGTDPLPQTADDTQDPQPKE